jgi:hypothetical protein
LSSTDLIDRIFNEESVKTNNRPTTQQPLGDDKANQILRIIECLGDVNKTAYFNALRTMFWEPQPILATFQVGVTTEFLKYFWSLKWRKEDLNEEKNRCLEEFMKFRVEFVEGSTASLDLDPDQPTLFILRNPTEDPE